jgi:hypothetical protein
MFQTSFLADNFSIADSKELYLHIFQKLISDLNFLLKIQLILFGSGLYFSGIESQVFLHIITAFCNCFTSLSFGETE